MVHVVAAEAGNGIYGVGVAYDDVKLGGRLIYLILSENSYCYFVLQVIRTYTL